MVQVTLFTFSKYKNSTKQPNMANGVTENGEFKKDFAVSELEITFNFGAIANAPFYNYCYIPNLRRYYFIVDWYYTAGLWNAVCVVDVLASYKTQIGGSHQYVIRAYSDYDPNIIDGAYMTKADNILRFNDSLTPTAFWGASAWGTNGTVVIGTVGSGGGAVGAVTYYAMALSTFASFMNVMLSGISWMNISTSEISEELQKALINPTQYIVSCRWFPILYSGFSQGSATNTIYLGWWAFNVAQGARILSNISSAWVYRENELTIPHNPQAIGNARLAYTDLSPYSTYTFKFLPFGVFNIDSTELYDKMYMGVRVDVNLMTGDAVLKLSAKGPAAGSYIWENAFLVTEGQVGVTLPVGQISADIGKYKQAIQAGGIVGLLDAIGEW